MISEFHDIKMIIFGIILLIKTIMSSYEHQQMQKQPISHYSKHGGFQQNEVMLTSAQVFIKGTVHTHTHICCIYIAGLRGQFCDCISFLHPLKSGSYSISELTHKRKPD